MSKPAVVTLKDVEIALEAPAEGSAAKGWTQFAKVGRFYRKDIGWFSITAADLANVVKNFETITPKDPTELPVDFNHGTAKENKTPESAKAAGWIKALELRANGNELWALVEWTDEAATRILSKEYRYISPVLAFNYTHQSGKNIGTTLLSAALTNTPFLEGMEPVTLSREQALALGIDDELDPVAYSFEEKARRIRRAVSDGEGVCPACKERQIRGQNQLFYVASGSDVYNDHAIARCMKCGALCRFSYSLNQGGEIGLGDVSEVVANYVPVKGRPALSKGTAMPKFKVNGQEVEVADEVVAAITQQISQTVVPLDKFAALETKVVELSASNVALRTELETERTNAKKAAAETKVAALIRSGKAMPVEKDGLVTLALEKPELFDTLTANRPTLVKLETEHGTASGGAAGESPAAQVVAMARSLVEKDKTLSLEAATQRVLAENPDLYDAYRAEVTVKV